MTVFLLGSGYLFGSFSSWSLYKWNDDLVKVDLEEEIVESDSDSDDDNSYGGKYHFGVKKIDQKIFTAQRYFLYETQGSCNREVLLNPNYITSILNHAVPLWLRVRHLLI